MKKAIYIATVTNLFSQETLESTIYSSVSLEDISKNFLKKLPVSAKDLKSVLGSYSAALSKEKEVSTGLLHFVIFESEKKEMNVLSIYKDILKS